MKLNVVKDLKTDQNLEVYGFRYEYGPYVFYLARAGGANESYQKRMFEVRKKHGRAMDTGNLPEKLAVEIQARNIAETILKAWEGVIDEETGEAVPFSVEVAYEVLVDLPELASDLYRQAMNIDNYRRSALEAEAGN